MFNHSGLPKTGHLYTGQVLKAFPGGLYRLSLEGRTVTVRADAELQSGQQVQVHIGKQAGVLRLISPGTESVIARAFIQAGLALPDSTEMLRRAALLNRTKGHIAAVSRLFAELTAMGADPGADFLEYVSERFRQPGKNPSKWNSLPDSAALKHELTEHSGEPDSLFTVLNHAASRKDAWLFARTAHEYQNRQADLMWKIRTGLEPALALSIQDGRRRFDFLIEGLNPARLKVYTDSHIDSDAWKKFRVNLKNTMVHDTLFPAEESDGFSSWENHS